MWIEVGPLSRQLALQVAIGFTLEDLQANRDGYMTKHQRKELNYRRRLIRVARLGLIMFAPVMVGLYVQGASAPKDGMMLTSEVILINAVFLAVLLLIAFGITFLLLHNLNKDLRKGDVVALEGRVQIYEMGSESRGKIYFLAIDETSFRVSKAVSEAFHKGDDYRIYIAPNTRTILSADWLG
jgi:hypothetical protein